MPILKTEEKQEREKVPNLGKRSQMLSDQTSDKGSRSKSNADQANEEIKTREEHMALNQYDHKNHVTSSVRWDYADSEQLCVCFHNLIEVSKREKAPLLKPVVVQGESTEAVVTSVSKGCYIPRLEGAEIHLTFSSILADIRPSEYKFLKEAVSNDVLKYDHCHLIDDAIRVLYKMHVDVWYEGDTEEMAQEFPRIHSKLKMRGQTRASHRKKYMYVHVEPDPNMFSELNVRPLRLLVEPAGNLGSESSESEDSSAHPLKSIRCVRIFRSCAKQKYATKQGETDCDSFTEIAYKEYEDDI